MTQNKRLHGSVRIFTNSIEVTLNDTKDSYNFTLFMCTKLAKLGLSGKKVQEQQRTSAGGYNYYTSKMYFTQKDGRVDLGVEKFLKPIKKVVRNKGFVITETETTWHSLNRSNEVEIFIEKPAPKKFFGIWQF